MTRFSLSCFVALGLGIVAVPALAAPPIWVVEDEDSTIYMMGTVHMMREGVNWRSADFDAVLAEADEIWLEIDIMNPPPNMLGLIMQYGISPDVTLTDLLSDEEGEILAEILGRQGVPLESMNELRPWFAYLQLSGLMLAQADFEAGQGIDMQIAHEATLAGKPIRGFETFEGQFRVLADMPEDVQLDMLRQTILDYDEALGELQVQLESWIDGDLDTIARMTEEMEAEAPDFYEALFVRRNHGFVDGIEDILRGEGTVLVAVGLGHYFGPQSIPEILAERGYTVEQR